MSSMTCHGDGTSAPIDGDACVALVGAPNSGKSTLFNALCSTHSTTGNWPGTSVEVNRSPFRLDGAGVIELLDLPGAYSLDPQSPDEALTRDLLHDDNDGGHPDVVVVTVSAVHMESGLYILAQLLESPRRLLLALTMNDLAARRGIAVDVIALAAATGVPVVVVNPRAKDGVGGFARSLTNVLRGQAQPAQPVQPTHPARKQLGGSGIADATARRRWVSSVIAACCSMRPSGARRTDRLDRWLTSPTLGPLLFLAVMWMVFQSTTTIASPFVDLLGSFFSGPLAHGATWGLDHIGLGHTFVRGLVVDGLIGGVGTVLTFVPLMAIMFLLLAALEDSGYMARAAVVTDRMMRTIGLPGRAFLPLVVGFGCNVPAIAATRVLPDARHRILTTLLVPFTSCTARLPVYVLVASIFFPQSSGNVVFAMYVISIVLVIGVGFLLRHTLWRTMGAQPLLLQLPPYQLPTPRLALRVMWFRLRGFIRGAAGIIVVTVVAIWFLQATPVSGNGSFGNTPLENSAYAGVARTVSPVLAPAGFDDWRAAGTLVVGFVAKEAVVASWAQTYAAEDDAPTDATSDAIRRDITRSSNGHPEAAMWAFLLFVLAYTPCVATVAAQRRAIGARWTAFGVVFQLTFAWLLASATFNVLRLIL